MPSSTEDTVQLWSSLQDNTLLRLADLLQWLTAQTDDFPSPASRSVKRHHLRAVAAHCFRQPRWRHLKPLYHGEIDRLISRALTGDVARELEAMSATCRRLSTIELACYSGALTELRHQGFLIDNRAPGRRCLIAPFSFLRFDADGHLIQPLDILAGEDESALACIRRTFTDNGFQVIQRGRREGRLTRFHLGSDRLSEDIWAWRHCRSQLRAEDEGTVFL